MSKETNSLIKFCSFVALLLAAILIFITNILPLIKVEITGQFINVLALIKDIALLIGIGFGAWGFVAGKTKGWKIVFWVALVIYIAGAVLGLF